MKKSKTVFLFLFLLINAAGAFCQSEWMAIHADKRVSEINAEIISVDKEAALSQTQKEQLHALLMENFTAIRDIKKGDAGDEEKGKQVTAKRKELWAKIHQNIFTKEQRVARKKAREKAGH